MVAISRRRRVRYGCVPATRSAITAWIFALDDSASSSSRVQRGLKNPALSRAASMSSATISSRTRREYVAAAAAIPALTASAAKSADWTAKKIPSRVIGSTRPAASPIVSQPSPESSTRAKSASPSDGIGHECRLHLREQRRIINLLPRRPLSPGRRAGSHEHGAACDQGYKCLIHICVLLTGTP